MDVIGRSRLEADCTRVKETNGSFDRSSTQCSTKVKQLKKQYKDEVDTVLKSGVGLESDDELLFRLIDAQNAA